MGTTVHSQKLGAHRVRFFWFHYRADVLLGLFDPLHLREVRYSCASTKRVLVFYLPNRQFGFHAKKVKSRSVRDNRRKRERDTQHSTKTHSRHEELNTHFLFVL